MEEDGGKNTGEVASSRTIQRYFDELQEKTDRCYEIAKSARKKGYDPKTDVEIPQAEDLAKRVQKLTEVEDTAEKIRELSEEYGREKVSIRIAKEVANREEGTKRERLENAVRVGLAVLTEGILVAPLEGIDGVQIRENRDGSSYLEISFAGPIRSAGGTGQALSVLIGDIVRREMDIGPYKATMDEIQRYKEEIPLYDKSTGLQYTPSGEEISLIIEGCPVSISGEGTGPQEVSGNRDLPRVDTNRVRGGACLVIAEGMTQKAPKLKKHTDGLDIKGWDFLEEYIDKYGTSKSEGDDDDEKKEGISPNKKYIKDTIAGRPIFSHPSEKGGLRLRYGRSRVLGLAAIGINPATMYATDEFMAIGTQLKTERPGKAGGITPCDSIEGATVLLKDGSVTRIDSPERARELQADIEEIIDLGEILIPYGEFLENNHPLVPAAYCHEWWKQEINEDIKEPPSAEEAVELSEEEGYPLHPEYLYFWDYVKKEDIVRMRDIISEKGSVEDDLLKIDRADSAEREGENDEIREEIKGLLESVGIPHVPENDEIDIHEPAPLLFTLGLNRETLEKEGDSDEEDTLDYLSELSSVSIRSKGPTTIGTRMARPEKTKERKMSPPVHVLFPVGESGGNERLIKKAVEEDIIEAQVSIRKCKECGKKGAQVRCSCGGRREITHRSREEGPKEEKLPMSDIYQNARSTLGEGGNIEKVKGVKGLITEKKTPEALEKGFLRAKHKIWAFKDGTCRYDMTDLPLSHFKPGEIGISVEEARELGYEEDVEGEELTDPGQVVEIRPQDMVISTEGLDYMERVADYVDDLLEKYYDLEPFYDLDKPRDLIGEMIVGLAPHTSGGVLGRIIGYHTGRAGYSHPFFHAAKRRNCDGDEDCIMLLMDGLLNFSRDFLPDRRGGLMDAPLVLTTKIDPAEIDSEAHNIDGLYEYPLEFYRKAEEYADPQEIQELMDVVEDRLGTEKQFQDIGYTHDLSDIADAPRASRYTRLNKMKEKMEGQLRIAEMIRAVDGTDVASRVIRDHFIPDMMGNFNKFGLQEIRCTSCNRKYRRPPLNGECSCGGNLILTIHEGSVKKYLNESLDMAERFDIPPYLKQRVEKIGAQIESVFENDKVSNPSLEEFC